MNPELPPLLAAAASIGLLHTLFGPDHYVPFIAMQRARGWSLAKTAAITFLCGAGHVLSSVVLGAVGIALGIAVHRLEAIESFRGDIAAWTLIAFGLLYFAWGVRQAIRNQPHRHAHAHLDAAEHDHAHVHHADHVHPHVESGKPNITPWILFTIFVFGPCEPLIPLLMYPAAQGSAWGVALVTAVFGAVTIGTMLCVVLAAAYGVGFVRLSKLDRYTHALAGATIALCGAAIQVLGL